MEDRIEFTGKMKWYNFLCCFYVWVNVLYSFIALLIYPRAMIFLLLEMALGITAGYGMLSYKWYGIRALFAMFALPQFISMIFDFSPTGILTFIIAFFVIIPLNIVYFGKRKELFS